ncbi:MAG: hypothetical protein HUU46_10320 [Candidatus Hydrogenedentes bacterium]|nr:hypothetical protein [Candidatus Hydrogenedentota bacterium]
MSYRLRRYVAGLVVGIGVLALLPANAQGGMQARVSFDEGATLIRGTNDSDWGHATTNTIVLPGDSLWVRERGTAEIEMSAGTFVRMADGSNIDLESLPPSVSLRAIAGSLYVHRLSRSSGDVLVKTPACDVMIESDTCARIDVREAGSTTISVRWGLANVSGGDRQWQRVAARQRVYVDTGYLPSQPVDFDPSEEDDFDAWNRSRVGFLATGADNLPDTVRFSGSTIGYSELGYYGEWRQIEGRTYWQPTYVADFVPYRHGYWSYLPRTGHCWIDEYPFGYITCHYGRWHHFPSYGWCWSYDPVWSPAWVASIRYGPNYLWTPVDYYNRPVIVSAAATFDIGGVAFSLAASTFVPQDYLYFGTAYVAPVRPAVVQNINVTSINIWNINDARSAPLVQVPFKTAKFTTFKSSPKAVLRGPERLAKNDAVARDVVATLEKSRDTQAKRAVLTAAEEGKRTVDRNGRKSAVKQETTKVRLDADQKQARPRVAKEIPTDRRRPADQTRREGVEKKQPAPVEQIQSERQKGLKDRHTIDTGEKKQEALRTRPGEHTYRDGTEKKVEEPQRTKTLDREKARSRQPDERTDRGRIETKVEQKPRTQPRDEVKAKVREDAGAGGDRTMNKTDGPKKSKPTDDKRLTPIEGKGHVGKRTDTDRTGVKRDDRSVQKLEPRTDVPPAKSNRSEQVESRPRPKSETAPNRAPQIQKMDPAPNAGPGPRQEANRDRKSGDRVQVPKPVETRPNPVPGSGVSSPGGSGRDGGPRAGADGDSNRGGDRGQRSGKKDRG